MLSVSYSKQPRKALILFALCPFRRRIMWQQGGIGLRNYVAPSFQGSEIFRPDKTSIKSLLS
jgi:hypothetical protein